MFSTGLLRYEVYRGRVQPSYLDQRYTELARCLLTHYEAFAGQPYRALVESIDGVSALHHYDARVVAGLRRVIEEHVRLEVDAPVPPRRVRANLFELAAACPDAGSETVLRELAGRMGVAVDQIERSLYADIRRERQVRFRSALPSSAELISRYNFRLLQGFFLHALRLRVEASSQLKAIYRMAKLHGLLVELKGMDGGPASRLEISGPLSLFRRTRKYGYALSRFLPACATVFSYRLEAEILLRERALRLVVTQADRILSSHRPPREFDSALERRFCADFVRLRTRWEIARESELIPLGRTAFFPDFTFRLRDHPEVRVDMEIVGFWTRDYLARKRALLAVLPRRKIIFCVDRGLSCDVEDCDFPCIWFSRRVPAGEVLQALDELSGSS